MKRQKETARKARQQEKLLRKQAARAGDPEKPAEAGAEPAPAATGDTP